MLAELGEIHRMASEMAASAVGLRGYDAERAKRAAAREHKRRRWEAIAERAAARSERLILRDMKDLRARVERLLSSKDT